MEVNTKKVVVVDDSKTTLLLIQNLLIEIDKNIQVKLFDSAVPALRYIKEHKPDLLIVDLYMPKISGIDLLRTLHPVTDMKVFMVSANTKVIKIETALKLGVDEYFTKPLKINKLKEKIMEALNVKREKYQL